MDITCNSERDIDGLKVCLAAFYFVILNFPKFAGISCAFCFPDQVKFIFIFRYNCPIRIIIANGSRYNKPSGKLAEKFDILPATIDWIKKRKYPFNFSTEASIDLSDDEELMQMMFEAGFDGVFVGIETPDEECLAECNKSQNRNRDLVACVKKIQKFGLEVHGGFIVGFDSDPPSIFKKQIEFIQKSRIVTAMVGLLNAPRGSKLYKRIEKEGRLLKDISGDNTDFSTNIIPKMGQEKLVRGYRNIIREIYSPRPYYERVKEFLRDYKPLEKKMFHLHFGHLRYHFGYVGAFFKSAWSLGIIDKERVHYWKLVFWSLLRRPQLLSMAIGYTICGFHFRKVFKNYL